MSLNPQHAPGKRISLTDAVIIMLGVSLVGSLSAWQWQEKHAADTAIVHNSENGTVHLALHTDQTHNIRGRLGDSQLQVSSGKIRFKNSPCNRRVCIHAGWLKESGEAAACLPNGISVVLHSDSPRYDSINF